MAEGGHVSDRARSSATAATQAAPEAGDAGVGCCLLRGSGSGMADVEGLQERLRKIEALMAGAGTPGERDAAGAALERVKARLAEQARRDPPIELQFSMPDAWSRQLFVALCRRYGLQPYRYSRQ